VREMTVDDKLLGIEQDRLAKVKRAVAMGLF
jgi:hypothetical protein